MPISIADPSSPSEAAPDPRLLRSRFFPSPRLAIGTTTYPNLQSHRSRLVDRLAPADAVDGARWLESHQRRDGSFGAHPYAEKGDPSPEGADLTAATMELMRQLLPGPWLAHLPATLVRYLAGDGCADLLAVPAGDWTRVLLDGASDLEGWIEEGDHETRITRLVQKAASALMKGCAGLAREGKGVQFRMPAALVRSWG